MHIDRYTKVVLTVIALALVYLCAVLPPLGTTVHAQPETHVVITGWKGVDGKVYRISDEAPIPVMNAPRQVGSRRGVQ